jgi:hypothetical protein
MMRFAWLAVMSAAVLSACGGGVESPNFDDQVVGIQITPDPVRVDVGGTVQLVAQGLYSLPPGQTSSVPCSTGFCSVGPAPSSVVWTIDGAGSSQKASIDSSSGLVRGLRHGTATVSAQFRGYTDSAPALVGGEVLTAIEVKSTETGSATTTALGRSIAYSATGTYTTYACTAPTSGSESGNCTVASSRTAPTSVNWALANATLGTPSPAQGSDTIVQSLQQGATTLRATVTNAEGDPLTASQPFAVTQPVLEEIVIAPDNQSAPVGTTKNFTVTGRYSNSTSFGEIPSSAVDIKWASSQVDYATVVEGPGTSTVATAVSTGSSAPNSTVTVTLTARALDKSNNPIKDENGNNITDTALFVVTQADLLEVLQACPVSTTTGAVECPTGATDSFNLPASTSAANPDSKREVRLLGRFSNSEEPQEISDSFINWTASSNLAAVSAQGIVSAGTAVGAVVVTGTIKAGVYPNATVRSDAIQVNLTDRVCVIPLRSADGATVSGTPTPSTTPIFGNPSGVTDAGNVIDDDANNFATVALAAGPLDTEIRLAVSAAAGIEFPSEKRVGFIIERATNSVFVPGDTANNSGLGLSVWSGGTEYDGGALSVNTLPGASASNRVRELVTVATPTTKPTFNRVDMTLTVPGFLTSDPVIVGPVLGLLDFLLLSGSTEFTVYGSCAQAVLPN